MPAKLIAPIISSQEHAYPSVSAGIFCVSAGILHIDRFNIGSYIEDVRVLYFQENPCFIFSRKSVFYIFKKIRVLYFQENPCFIFSVFYIFKKRGCPCFIFSRKSVFYIFRVLFFQEKEDVRVLYFQENPCFIFSVFYIFKKRGRPCFIFSRKSVFYIFRVLYFQEKRTSVFYIFKEIKILPDYRVCPSFRIAARQASSGEKFIFYFWEEHMSSEHVNKIQQEIFCNFDYHLIIV